MRSLNKHFEIAPSALGPRYRLAAQVRRYPCLTHQKLLWMAPIFKRRPKRQKISG